VKIKRFFAKDMRSALNQVKEALGSDAVIMSNKKVTGGIEIVAAIEHQTKDAATQPEIASEKVNGRSLASDSVSLSSSSFTKSNKSALNKTNTLGQVAGFPDKQSLSAGLNSILKRQQEVQRKQVSTPGQAFSQPARQSRYSNASAQTSRQPEENVHKTSGFFNQTEKPQSSNEFNSRKPFVQNTSPSAMESMQKQIDSIKNLLEHQVSGLMWQEMDRREPLRAMLIKRLTRLGFGDQLSDQLACFIPEEFDDQQAWQHLQTMLTDQLATGNNDILSRGGVVALLGATGVGKTTTVAKLAAQAVAKFGAHQVTLVSTDTYRIGAHEQLATYGRIMGCSVKVAQNEQELSEILYQLKDKKLVLIDTAGMSQRDVRLQEQLDNLMNTTQVKINSYLVLSATAQRMVIEETFEQFKRIPLAGTILTKLDEALSLGEVLNVLLRQSLPVTYITNGQRVPEDIEVADAEALISYALNVREEESEPHFWVCDEQEQGSAEGMTNYYE